MPIKQSVTPQDVASLLNEMFLMDKSAVEKLLTQRVDANAKLANHPTIQVKEEGFKTSVGDKVEWSDGPHYRVGILGILNGLFGVYDEGDKFGSGCLVAEKNDETGAIEGFKVQVSKVSVPVKSPEANPIKPPTNPPVTTPITTPESKAENTMTEGDGAAPADSGSPVQ